MATATCRGATIHPVTGKSLDQRARPPKGDELNISGWQELRLASCRLMASTILGKSCDSTSKGRRWNRRFTYWCRRFAVGHGLHGRPVSSVERFAVCRRPAGQHLARLTLDGERVVVAEGVCWSMNTMSASAMCGRTLMATCTS